MHLFRNEIKVFVMLVVALSATTNMYSQDPDLETLLNKSYDDFVKEVRQEYTSFRDRVNQEYADFMRSFPWVPTKIETPLPVPINKDTEPDYTKEDEKVIEEIKPIVIEEIIEIVPPKPQPQPIEEIKEIPSIPNDKSLNVDFYGTNIQMRNIDLSGFTLSGSSEEDFARGWEFLSRGDTSNLLADCLKVREQYSLPDWGYVKFTEILSSNLKGKDSNEKSLLQGFLLNQSGYKIRFAYDKDHRLHVLFATPGIMYEHNRYYLDDDWYYSYTNPEGSKVSICNFGMPREQSIDLGIEKLPLLDYEPGNLREITVKRYPDVKVSVTPNKNLINFFNDYPYATLDSSPYSLWAIHGNTPVSKEIREQLYPTLRQNVKGKTQLEALQFLLKVAQSFPYEYDEKIWGRDRTFWMEESWEYPYSDCEDHAINFSHMVRDILELDVCLVYYPGHLSSCVALTDNDVTGDYITYQGKKYYICDPTFFYGNVGRTAPSNNNSEAILIPLRR